MTYDQFQKKYLGVAVDYDGVAGVQCVDLVDQYLKDVFGITGVYCNGARELFTKFNSYPALVKNFNKIADSRDFVVKKGDILIWNGGTWGHCGLGTGKGNIDWFESLEENTFGRHEPTQLVKHYFNSTSGADYVNPFLGVLRPKDQDKVNGTTTRVLDKTGFKKGDKTNGVLAVKELILQAYKKGIIKTKVLEDNGFGEGTENAVNELLKKWGYKQNGIAGENFIKKLASVVK